MPLLVASIALGFLGSSIVELWGDSGGTARGLFVAAAGALAAAAVLRVVGYARTAVRTAVALALLGLMARLAVDVGLLSGGPLDHGSTSRFALFAGALLALAALVELVTSLLGHDAESQSGVSVDRLPLQRASRCCSRPRSRRAG